MKIGVVGGSIVWIGACLFYHGSAASLKVMNFYDDMGRFKFLLDVFICKSYSRGSFMFMYLL